jgi:hypothetical protein
MPTATSLSSTVSCLIDPREATAKFVVLAPTCGLLLLKPLAFGSLLPVARLPPFQHWSCLSVPRPLFFWLRGGVQTAFWMSSSWIWCRFLGTQHLTGHPGSHRMCFSLWPGTPTSKIEGVGRMLRLSLPLLVVGPHGWSRCLTVKQEEERLAI